MSKRVLVNLVVFLGVFAIMCGWALRALVTIDAIERPYDLSADFEGAYGVMANAEVAYLGLNYGRVTKVEQGPGHVTISMKIHRGKEIPEGSVASIFRKSALGEPYIDFAPPPDLDPDHLRPLAAGTHLGVEHTRVPLEFSELLRSASRLLEGIEPGQAGTLIDELAAALDGNGDTFKDLLTATDHLAATLVTRTEALDRLADSNTVLSGVFADHIDDVGASIANLAALSETLEAVTARGDLDTVFVAGSELVQRLADLLGDQKANVDCVLDDLSEVIDLVSSPRQLDNLGRVLAVGPEGFGTVLRTIDWEPSGAWTRVNLVLTEIFNNPAAEYVPRKAAPEVPARIRCDSPLVAAAALPGPAADFVPSSVTGSDGGSGAVVAAGALGSVGAGALIIALWRTSHARRR